MSPDRYNAVGGFFYQKGERKSALKKKCVLYVVAGALLFTSGCSDTEDNSGTSVSNEVVDYLMAQQTADVKEVLDKISYVESSREQVIVDSIEASEAESRSIEESIAQSIAESEYESSSIEASIEESIEESIAESSSIEASIEASIEYSIAESEAESRYIEASLAKESEEISIAESIAVSIAESSSIQASVDASIAVENSIAASIAASVAESAAAESSSIAASVAASLAESRAAEESLEASSEGEATGTDNTDYLNQLCAGTHMTPYGVTAIDSSDQAVINKLFEHSVVIGDSRVEGVAWVLSSSYVFALRGAHAYQLYDTARQAAYMYPDKALFWVGLNDMGIYGANVDKFIDQYVALVADFLSINPGCKIYICSQPPVNATGLANYPNSQYVDLYNAAMQQMCSAHGWTYIDCSTYLRAEYYASDGLHFSKTYYQYWIQDMANQMGLWGDLRG